jgi:hypothetical protein
MKAAVFCPAQEHELSKMVSFDVAVSFLPYIEYIEQRLEQEKTIKVQFYKAILREFEKHPELRQPLALEDIHRYELLLEYLYVTLSDNMLGEEKDRLWGLSTPLHPVFFYATDTLYNIISYLNSHVSQDITMHHAAFEEERIGLVYAFIMARMYDYNRNHKSERFRSIIDPVTGLKKYFRLNFDIRFIRLTAKAPLPELSYEEIQDYFLKPGRLKELQQVLPLDMFFFEGFSVLTLSDVTPEYVVEDFKASLLDKSLFGVDTHYRGIVESLQVMGGCKEIEFGLLPFLTVNEKPVFNKEISEHSVLIGPTCDNSMNEAEIQAGAEQYLNDPRPLYYQSVAKAAEAESHPVFLEGLVRSCIASFALLPVFYNKKLTGVLEVYARKPGMLTEAVLARLDPAIPLVGRLFQNNIEQFESRIENIIKENFTSIQAAVQWKFNETAWKFLKDSAESPGNAMIETIAFDHVHPMYGSVDIRNSTIERNYALRLDLQTQFSLLLKTLTALDGLLVFGLLEKLIFECRKWLGLLSEFITANEETQINEFFKMEVDPLLDHFKAHFPETRPAIDEYLQASLEPGGVVYEHRSNLEQSMLMVTAGVGAYLDSSSAQLQRTFPFYLEKFSTDGVEYDIYIGQSITPEKPFDLLYLKNVRFWQIKSMAAIARLTHALRPQMPTPLETTQLIFAHPNAINISFRTDERRFDVEGAYNTRYQVIKKRIDKVHIKDTAERLTQPGRIAIVYYNAKEADEYIRYIQSLQEQHLLHDDLEMLDLEDLQGVAGLKAIRVGVRVE